MPISFGGGGGGGGGGGDDAYDWATEGNVDLVPRDKIGVVGRASDLAATGTGTATVTPTVSAPPVFSAAMGNLTAIAGATTWSDVLSGLTAGSLINIGGFTIETVASRDVVVFAADGNYEISSTVSANASDSTAGTARSTLVAKFVRTRGGLDTTLLPQGVPTYSRNQYGAYSQLLGSHMSAVLAFEAGDKLRVQVLFRTQSSNPTLSIVGASSNLTITGVDAPTVSATADVTVDVDVAGLVGSVIDVSGENIDPPDADDQGSVWLDTYKHDVSFAVRKFRATTIALGTGTALTTVDIISNTRPPLATAADQIWYQAKQRPLPYIGRGRHLVQHGFRLRHHIGCAGLARHWVHGRRGYRAVRHCW